MSKFRFQGGEIVRLRHDMETLKAGCCGVVWGVYDMNPPLYEACFVNESGQEDLMFSEQDVEQIPPDKSVPFSERLMQIRNLLGHPHD